MPEPINPHPTTATLEICIASLARTAAGAAHGSPPSGLIIVAPYRPRSPRLPRQRARVNPGSPRPPQRERVRVRASSWRCLIARPEKEYGGGGGATGAGGGGAARHLARDAPAHRGHLR